MVKYLCREEKRDSIAYVRHVYEPSSPAGVRPGQVAGNPRDRLTGPAFGPPNPHKQTHLVRCRLTVVASPFVRPRTILELPGARESVLVTVGPHCSSVYAKGYQCFALDAGDGGQRIRNPSLPGNGARPPIRRMNPQGFSEKVVG